MKVSTVVRFCGAIIIFFVLAELGEMQVPRGGLVISIIGFAAVIELLVVRPLQRKERQREDGQ